MRRGRLLGNFAVRPNRITIRAVTSKLLSLITAQSLAAMPPHLRTDGVWAQFTTISNAVLALRRALPAPSDPRGTEPLETIGRANPGIAHAHIELQAATILLSNAVMDVPDFPYSNEMALEAASGSAAVMKQATGEGGVLPAMQAPVSLLVCLRSQLSAISPEAD